MLFGSFICIFPHAKEFQISSRSYYQQADPNKFGNDNIIEIYEIFSLKIYVQPGIGYFCCHISFSNHYFLTESVLGKIKC